MSTTPTSYEVMIKEWEYTESLIRHFDDILVRLRLYVSTIYFVALGFVITIITTDVTLPYLGKLGLAAISSIIPVAFSITIFFIYKFYRNLMHETVARARDLEKEINQYLLEKEVNTQIKLNEYVSKKRFPKFLKLSQEHWLYGIYIILSLMILIGFIIARILVYY